MFMGFKYTAVAVAVLSSVAMQTNAAELTVISYGGALKEAQSKAFYTPFEKSAGVSVIASDYNGEMAKIKAMVDTKTVTWDVVDVEDNDLVRGCDEGLFEKIDVKKIGDKANFVPGAVQACGIGAHVWSTVLAYDADRLKTPPTSWKDFWDVKKYPGKRALRKTARGALEAALMADGVAPKDVYKTLSTSKGVDRAFKKLDQLKPYIQWWEAGAQPPQYLASGDVVMSSAYNGRISAAQKSGKNLKVVWNGSLYQFDFWAIPKGSPNKDNAMKYLAFAGAPENQKVFAENIAYGPTNKKALGLLSKQILDALPTSPANIKNALNVNVVFWADYGETLEQRFNAWASK
ncbi:ABC transporter substrate-binding protein [Leeia sp. TBRC 13508]|uniref:ABC transporter substrate-binding protein n=1 Tax=Leeia speluncae TaxID=2884804 RepID=A0ABS8DAY8_9NEIS|nr:ABC transporter substrate-binding protein [Leeia speluncae]MCB6185378.1 ABC transporter substrate-binding protein [Leeia speluncae]